MHELTQLHDHNGKIRVSEQLQYQSALFPFPFVPFLHYTKHSRNIALCTYTAHAPFVPFDIQQPLIKRCQECSVVWYINNIMTLPYQYILEDSSSYACKHVTSQLKRNSPLNSYSQPLLFMMTLRTVSCVE